MPQYVVCPTVRLSVTFTYRDHIMLDYFENNFTAHWLKVYAQAHRNMGDLVQHEHLR